MDSIPEFDEEIEMIGSEEERRVAVAMGGGGGGAAGMGGGGKGPGGVGGGAGAVGMGAGGGAVGMGADGLGKGKGKMSPSDEEAAYRATYGSHFDAEYDASDSGSSANGSDASGDAAVAGWGNDRLQQQQQQQLQRTVWELRSGVAPAAAAAAAATAAAAAATATAAANGTVRGGGSSRNHRTKSDSAARGNATTRGGSAAAAAAAAAAASPHLTAATAPNAAISPAAPPSAPASSLPSPPLPSSPPLAPNVSPASPTLWYTPLSPILPGPPNGTPQHRSKPRSTPSSSPSDSTFSTLTTGSKPNSSPVPSSSPASSSASPPPASIASSAPGGGLCPGIDGGICNLRMSSRTHFRLMRCISLGTVLAGLGYLSWKCFIVGRNITHAGPACLLFLSTEILVFLSSFMLVVELSKPAKERKALSLPPSGPFPRVAILICCCSEKIDVIQDTVKGAMNQNYPGERYSVWVLDDGGDDELKAWLQRQQQLMVLQQQQGRRLFYLRRPKKKGVPHHFKAGNINYGLHFACGEFVAVLDADMIPSPFFLSALLPHIVGEEKGDVAFVQCPQSFYNIVKGDPLNDSSQDFYDVLLPYRDGRDSAQCVGTGVIFRAAHLQAIGGFTVGSITEDFDTAMTLHAKGYKTAYVNQRLQAGLAPWSLEGYIKQHQRWATGSLQILLHRNPLLLRAPKFSLYRRISYWYAGVQYYLNVIVIMILVLPVLILALDLRIMPPGPIFETTRLYIILLVPYVFTSRLLCLGLFSRLPNGMMVQLRGEQVCMLVPIIHVIMSPTHPKVEDRKKYLNYDEYGVPYLRPEQLLPKRDYCVLLFNIIPAIWALTIGFYFYAAITNFRPGFCTKSGFFGYPSGQWLSRNKAPYGADCPFLKNVGPVNCIIKPRNRPKNWLNYRYRPKKCGQPWFSFAPLAFLQRMRNTVFASVGDSLSVSNLMPSLLCQLHQVSPVTEVPNDGTYAKQGPLTKVYQVKAYNVTLVNTWSTFLNEYWQDEQTVRQYIGVVALTDEDSVVNLDGLDAQWAAYIERYDVLILQTQAHWQATKYKWRRFWVNSTGDQIFNESRFLAAFE
ncbi:unnamed protein product [Closterium sp. Naga37s-1]|nr:unnamed protein product [Closterium sp. Naga37s-1]